MGFVNEGHGHSESWKKSKLDGHALELELGRKLKTDLKFANSVSTRVFGEPHGLAIEIAGGGTTEGKIPDVFGRSSNGKTDIYAIWKGDLRANFSVKMSPESQVFLTSVDRFCDGFQMQYGVKVPRAVRQILHLFIGDDVDLFEEHLGTVDLLGPMHNRTNSKLELHQHRFVGRTLEQFFEAETRETLKWLRTHMEQLTDMVFSRGYSTRPENNATHLWYFVSDHKSMGDIDFIVSMDRVRETVTKNLDCVQFRKNFGGSVLDLPFGKLQMHRPSGPNQMQFRHDVTKLGFSD